MPIFLKLCLAHLIADFILQFEELFQLKLKSIIGHLLHAFCHAAVSLLLLWPYLGHTWLWGFVLAISAIHCCQDLVKYRLMTRKKEYFFLIFVADQALHFLFLATVFFFQGSHQVLGFATNPLLNELYIEPRWTLYAIVFLVSTFSGSFVMHAFRTNFIPDSRPDHFITTWEIVYGIAERSVVTWLFIFAPNPWTLVFAPLLGLLRLFSSRVNNNADFFISFNYAAAVGMIFRLSVLK